MAAPSGSASSPNWGVGIALGLAVGAGFGVAMDNLMIGIAFGIAIGVSFAVALGRKPNDDVERGGGVDDEGRKD